MEATRRALATTQRVSNPEAKAAITMPDLGRPFTPIRTSPIALAHAAIAHHERKPMPMKPGRANPFGPECAKAYVMAGSEKRPVVWASRTVAVTRAS